MSTVKSRKKWMHAYFLYSAHFLLHSQLTDLGIDATHSELGVSTSVHIVKAVPTDIPMASNTPLIHLVPR